MPSRASEQPPAYSQIQQQVDAPPAYQPASGFQLAREATTLTTASRVTPAASFVSQNSFDGGPTCCLCLSAPRTVRLGPCGHACLCRECYANMTQQGSKLCPICRTTITSHTASDAVVRELTYLPGFTGSDPAVTNMGVEQGAPPQSSWLWGKKKAIWGAFLLGLASLLAFIIGLTVGNSSTQTQTPIQTPAPSARWAWAGGGCSTASTAHKWTQLNTSLSAAVRCCSVGGIEVTCDSDPSGTCLPAVATYAEAEQACAAAGMRLCSRGEIEDDICCGTGCGYDGHVVWTSDTEYLMCSHIFSMHDADWVMGSRASSDEFAFENVDVTPPEQLAPFDSSGHDSGNRLSRGAWAGDGCSTAGTAHKWTELNTSLSASVRCCSVGVSGIEVTCDSNPSGTCLPAVATYAEAEQACAAAGMRLCTRGEIEDGICCGTGCGYDGHVVWTSGPQGLSLSLSLSLRLILLCVAHTLMCICVCVCGFKCFFLSVRLCVCVPFD